MSRICSICGKGSATGNRIIRRGMAKKKGGIGLHTTAVNKRKFQPNLQKIRVVENGRVVRRLVCASCIRQGKVTKA
ncbi:MAG: 50S ribosomal protein L28 [Kiritimatiellia bacterium]